jgi:hypothetical protein
MIFEPKTEQEIVESKLWSKGEYAFEIVDASEKNSKSSGKPMIELKVKLSDGKGAGRTITDYLLAETPEKLRHCADACGVLDRYDTGSLSGNDFRGKRGKLKLGIEKDKKKIYPDKNVVLDYVCVESQKSRLATSGSGLKFE